MDPLHPHLQALHDALRAEEQAQRSAVEREARLPLGERVAVGHSWPPLRVLGADRLGRRARVDVQAPKGVVLHDGIGSGDPVSVEVRGSGEPVRGLCVGVGAKSAELLLDADVPAEGEVVVSRRFDPSTFVRYRQALERADRHKSDLRRVLLGERAPSPGISVPEPASFARLNEAQRRAGLHALGAAEIALIHGPPGTGKTTLLTALLEGLVADGQRPWALADSNAAVDHLAVSAADRGLEVVRLGHPARIGTRAAELSLDAHLERSPLASALAALDRDIARSWDDPRLRRTLLEERDALYTRARQHVLQSAQVIASTFGTLARLAPDLPAAHTAVVDEATQAVEPAVWTAVPWVERLILVGDPHQLGPVVVDPGNPLERSLLQRLLDEAALPLPMLEVQHRMHAGIRRLVADVYGPTYRDHEAVAGHLLCDLAGVAATPRTERACLWIDTAGAGLEEARDPVSLSLYNEGELRVIDAAARMLREAGVRPEDIGVIAPYSAQVARLSELPSLEGVEVATVNAFQGREKEAVLVSFVRSNDDGELGFVADGRRLTVALTRARRFLLCTGDTATLGTHPRFSRLFEVLAEQEGWRTVWEEPWAEAVHG